MPSHPAPSGEADPLLYFATEQETGLPSAEAAVGATTSEDRTAPQPAPNPLGERLEIVERDLAKANAEVALLRSDVATLVRVVDDIRTRKRQPQTERQKSERPATRTVASALVGMVLGVVAGAWLWTYTRASAEQIVPSPPVEQTVAAGPAPIATPEETAPVTATTTGAIQAPPAAEPSAVHKVTQSASTNYVGTLSIDGEPNGEVFIDRQSVGRTPLRLEKMKAGSHLIWIERDGYQRWTKVVQVPSDRVTRVWADLEPLTSR
ncbi:MAG TPA: PEGA domain-containing protein [Vicinamibacterales bacterium]